MTRDYEGFMQILSRQIELLNCLNISLLLSNVNSCLSLFYREKAEEKIDENSKGGNFSPTLKNRKKDIENKS